MKAGLVVGAAIATAVAVMVSCSPDRIPGSPLSATDAGASFNSVSNNGGGPQGGCKSVSGTTSGGSASGSTIQPPANCGSDNQGQGDASNSDSGLHCGNNGTVIGSGSGSAAGSTYSSRECKDNGQGNDSR